MRRFILFRHEDATGVSGTGRVVEGVQFSNGRCAYRWTTPRSTTTIADSIDDVVAIHGHDGRTELHWLDPEEGKLGQEHAHSEPDYRTHRYVSDARDGRDPQPGGGAGRGGNDTRHLSY